MKKRTIKKRIKWAIALGLALLLAASLWVLPVSAEEAETTETAVDGSMPEGFSELPSLLPPEVSERLPEGIGSEDAQEVGEAVGKLTDATSVLSLISDMVGDELLLGLRLFAKLAGLLLLAAVFGVLRSSLGSDALAGAVRFCTTTAIFAAILHTQLEHLQRVQVFFERLSAMMGAMIPMTGTVWAMGGNVTTASAGTSTLYVFLTVCENLCGKTVMPLCCFCIALALCNTLSPELGLGGISRAVKRIYTFSLGMIMTILVSCLGAQTALTAAADSTTARAARTISSTVIPVVGGSVGETLRTVASGVQYLKSVLGICGILFIFLLLLPTLLSLLMTRLAFLLAGGLAEMLGCESEGKLLGELGTVYGCMIAVVAMSSVMFILALSIFMKTVVAAA
ncbi:MAG: hypothetical protein IJW44_04240 [Clostridia bacterium]|nr:hypothetical protein [Clostridia bacterium]